MPYLNKESVVSASKTLNDVLISKGYIDEPLLFPTIDFEELKLGQIEPFPELVITEKIYNNDKNLINIIHGLIQSVDRNKDQNSTFNKILNRKDEKLKDLETRNSILENKIERLEKQVNQQSNDLTILNKRKNELTTINNLQYQDLTKLKQWCNDTKTRYQIELKKKNLEIDSLKDQLIEKKHLSTSITFGISNNINKSRPLDQRFPQRTSDINSNIIYHNNPIIDNSINTNDSELIVPIITNEYEKMLIHMTNLINRLLKENRKFTRFSKLINSYFNNLNNQLHQKSVNQSLIIDLPNPSSFIEDQTNNQEADDGQGEDLVDIKDVESYEVIINPLLNNIYKNNHYLNDLLDSLTTEDINEVEHLRNELLITKKNWENAMKTIDDWKSTTSRR